MDEPVLPPPPVAPVRPTRRDLHGTTLEDPYAWLRDPGYPEVTDPDVLTYLEAENAYADAVLAPDRELIDRLFEEMKGRLKDDDEGVPTPWGPWLYGWRFRAGAQYREWYRRPRLGGEETVFLDEPALAEGNTYFNLRTYAPSPDHRLVAFATDVDGSERYVIEVVDPATGARLSDRLSNTSGTPVWGDGETLFYAELNEQLRPFRVRRHRLGTAQDDDAVVFEEADAGFFVGLGRSLSGAFVTIQTGDHVTSEVHLIPTAAPHAEPRLVAARRAGHQYGVVHQGERLLIVTNDRHRNFRLVEAPLATPDEAHWRELKPGSDAVYLVGIEAFRDFLVVVTRERGLVQVRIERPDGSVLTIPWPEPTYSAGLGANADYVTDRLRLRYSSMVTPASVIDFHLADRRLEVLKVQEIPSGYDPRRYRSERLEATAPDGTKVPISVVYREDFAKDGAGSLLLYGYGSYGMGLDPGFGTARLSLLDSGFAYAIAHVRGGDELGRGWYEDGKLDKKTNSFTDFVACAEHLIADGFTGAGRIAIEGGSAGGMLVGAVLNLRPELWGCALALVPFVDVLNTMLDETLPLTPIEWPEWGNPIADAEAFHRLRGYCPYENVEAKAYPPILARAGLSDPRVTYWEAAKWVAKLRAVRTDDALLLLRTNMDAGHFGASGRYDELKERAEDYAFVLRCLGAVT
ncbi:MAG: S9 family peptidase [Pseudomonadota bacterium]